MISLSYFAEKEFFDKLIIMPDYKKPRAQLETNCKPIVPGGKVMSYGKIYYYLLRNHTKNTNLLTSSLGYSYNTHRYLSRHPLLV